MQTFSKWLEAKEELKHSNQPEKVRGKAPYSLSARTNLRNKVLGTWDGFSAVGDMLPKKDPPWKKPAEIEKKVIKPGQKWGDAVISSENFRGWLETRDEPYLPKWFENFVKFLDRGQDKYGDDPSLMGKIKNAAYNVLGHATLGTAVMGYLMPRFLLKSLTSMLGEWLRNKDIPERFKEEAKQSLAQQAATNANAKNILNALRKSHGEMWPHGWGDKFGSGMPLNPNAKNIYHSDLYSAEGN